MRRRESLRAHGINNDKNILEKVSDKAMIAMTYLLL